MQCIKERADDLALFYQRRAGVQPRDIRVSNHTGEWRVYFAHPLGGPWQDVTDSAEAIFRASADYYPSAAQQQSADKAQAEILALIYSQRVTVGHSPQGDRSWRVFFRTHDGVLHDVTTEAEALRKATTRRIPQ